MRGTPPAAKDAIIPQGLHSTGGMKMVYVDGFVAAAPTDGKAAYMAYSAKFWPIFQEFGALAMWECWGDDVPQGEVTSFPMAVKAQEGETVAFSWTVWPDKQTRDAGWQKMMEDPRMADMQDMPFDGKRMIYGGFTPALMKGKMPTGEG